MLILFILLLAETNFFSQYLNAAGFMFMLISFLGIGNCHSVQKFVEKERLVMCKERFLGMYYSIIYSLAQVLLII